MSSNLESFKLLDGTTIPWLGWGNGSGNAKKTASESGQKALVSGIRHIDTAQGYHNEPETGEVITKSGIGKEKVFVTSKISQTDDEKPIPVSQIRESVAGSLERLGFVPDLFLIHNPFVAEDQGEELKKFWQTLEALKDEGKLKSIGVSNFRPQDLELVLSFAKHKPVVNQLEYHPYVLAHLEPVLAIQEKHGILTEAYGPLTPLLRHPTGGPLKPILTRIAQRISSSHTDLASKTPIDEVAVLLLWTRAKGVVAVSASGNPDNIARLADISALPADLLTKDEVEEITKVGKGVHFRHYREHMEKDFALPQLPDGAK